MQTYAYGYPRLGSGREFKKIIEAFWKGAITESATVEQLDSLQEQMIAVYEAKVDLFPVGEITAYDPMFETAVMVGAYTPANLSEYYALCRGKNALEMTKWFNTNYHYLVPDFSDRKWPAFSVTKNRAKEYHEQFNRGIPYLIGPFTFLKLSKGITPEQFDKYLQSLTAVYREILNELPAAHIEEPAFVLELTDSEIAAIHRTYETLGETGAKMNLITYYDAVDFLEVLYELPVAGIGLDFVHGPANLDTIRKSGFPKGKVLIAGLIDGRNVWKNDMASSLAILKELSQYTSSLAVSNAGPLYHVPVTLQGETLPAELTERLAFANEKLAEIEHLADLFTSGEAPLAPQKSIFGVDTSVQTRVAKLKDTDFIKSIPLQERRNLHDQMLGLPILPTTTIGSFPQTAEVRKKRAAFRKGQIDKQEYQGWIRHKISDLVSFQENLGLDVLVHGEFERTDMVEFFAEKLEGIATTKNGWIISYGTRGYRPPIIYGDVSRPESMTIGEIAYAQTLTGKPVKGMLTGPVTIIAWSFARNDIPLANVAYQIGLALQDEIRDYEKADIKIVQVDEPAIREKAPLKRTAWPAYFDWAIRSFNLTTNTDPKTQIHTHICYSEFGEIIEQINLMDFDVISIETTRSRGDILESFEKIDFQRQIGLGVWDIHSPTVPDVKEMQEVVERALKVIPKTNFWINPDCGLKTRDWPETEASLRNLVMVAKQMR
ncbi:MAG: 5-methyltetrahydropteroyltriglutamate--homocysteine S-methyltransferase [Sedimentisphaerales bacterium]|nr:5-methyltetrahydropteroyltriglutamate--homocysteine S-methyltransferase [Sedimentisphaerales bacterium]